jgi:hypothetical protein
MGMPGLCRVCAGFIWRRLIRDGEGKEKNKLLQCTAILHQTCTREPLGEAPDLGLGRCAGILQPLARLDVERLLQDAPGDATSRANQAGVIVHEGPQQDVELPQLRALSGECGQLRIVESDGHGV